VVPEHLTNQAYKDYVRDLKNQGDENMNSLEALGKSFIVAQRVDTMDPGKAQFAKTA
jgi:hypothetical protein